MVMKIILDKKRNMNKFLIFIIIIISLSLISCGPKGPRRGDHSRHMDHGKEGHEDRSEYTLITKNDIKVTGAHDINFNNGTEEQYQEAANLSGDVSAIQESTEGLWPRVAKGDKYEIGDNEVNIKENDEFLIIETNNLPDHSLTTTNPNRARSKNYKFLIPKFPKMLDSPYKITKKTQEIGVALNGVVIAGPYDSQDKIAPYNRIVDECSSHADPQGMYHYHFAPLCLKNKAGDTVGIDPSKQIGWSFDGFKIYGLANRKKHIPIIDTCNGHHHDGEYHYHATIDFPFFMGCYVAQPHGSNFEQKKRGKKR